VRKWTLSACVALAWSIAVPLLATAGPVPLGHLDQATTTASITPATLASWPGTARAPLADAPGAPHSPAPEPDDAPASPARANTAQPSEPATALTVTAKPAAGPVTWTVRPGDTLSAIASTLAVPGGWQRLYTANRQAIGPDPNVIRPGTVLAVPGAAAQARYTVTPGDTLTAIATALGVPGGWQRLYTANRNAIGPDPNVIRPGTVLRLAPAVAARGQGSRATPAAGPGHQAPPSRHPAAPAPSGKAVPSGGAATASGTNASRATSPPAGSRHPAAGVLTPAGGMPQWLEDVLLAVGLLAATAFAAEPAAALARRRRAARHALPGTLRALGGMRRRARRAAARAKIILSSYDRLIVTYSADDHTVYVFTPPGEDPRAVLRAARLVLPEDTYEDLAGHLGVPSGWPRE
jgi:LysM repeat protein